jgi:glycosyltransferase involved in cell wall biosynthesis
VAYDFDQILNAAKIIQDTDPEVAFILQGKGELVPRIRRDIRRMNLRNVEFLDVFIPREEVSRLLDRADILILPLKDFGVPYPGISSKLYEYQAVGKPIICCSEGASANYIYNTKSGIIVKPGDSNELVKAVLFLKNHSIECIEMGKNGRIFVEKNASKLSIGFEMKTLFEKMIE